LMEVVVFPTPPFWLAIDRTQVKPLALTPGWQPQAYMWSPVAPSPLRLAPTLPILRWATQAQFDISGREHSEFWQALTLLADLVHSSAR
jgi:hypothetical protein